MKADFWFFIYIFTGSVHLRQPGLTLVPGVLYLSIATPQLKAGQAVLLVFIHPETRCPYIKAQTWKKFLTFLEPSLELKYFLGKRGILDILNIATNSVKSVSWVPWMWLESTAWRRKSVHQPPVLIIVYQEIFLRRSRT